MLLCALNMVGAGIKIDRIDPTDWFVGMKNSALQLMVYGPGIREAEVSTDYEGARITSVVRLDSPNYLLVYLDLSGAKAGQMNLNFSVGKKKQSVAYTLKDREMNGTERQGFTNADVLYMLMPDRFAQGNDHTKPVAGMAEYKEDRTQPSLRHGGDLEGIRQHLDYFNELGVTALWFTPVLENNSPDAGTQSTYHGYATTDYYRVDPRFGTNADYRRLCDEAHAKGLKVVMDMIFNHCGFDHPWVKDMPAKDWFNTPDWLTNPPAEEVTAEQAMPEGQSVMATPPVNSKYLQTSYKLTPVLDPYASDYDKKETEQGWFVPSMPDLNQHNPHVMTYLTQNSEWWIETVGINGIRMDTYPYAYSDAMAEWMRQINEEYPNFNCVGETWVTEPAYTAAFQKDSKVAPANSNLKTVMDFSFFEKINRAAHEETDAWWNGYNAVYNSLVYDYLYARPDNVLAFLDNHDTDRFLGEGQDEEALKQAMSLLLTMKRTPQIYYGTEIMMNGTKRVTDGNVRCDFPGGFPGDAKNAFTKAGRTPEQNAVFAWMSRLLHWRQGNEAIINGTQKQFCPYKGVYVLCRQTGDCKVVTIINGTKSEVEVPAARYAEVLGTVRSAHDVLSDSAFSWGDTIKLQPRQTVVLDF